MPARYFDVIPVHSLGHALFPISIVPKYVGLFLLKGPVLERAMSSLVVRNPTGVLQITPQRGWAGSMSRPRNRYTKTGSRISPAARRVVVTYMCTAKRLIDQLAQPVHPAIHGVGKIIQEVVPRILAVYLFKEIAKIALPIHP